MKKLKIIEAETHQLPEEIIQHIQSFLFGKEAARTTILSKSWYEAWLTRPNLDFCQWDITDDKAFMNFGMKTMQRYEKLNLKIQSLDLTVNGRSDKDLVERISLSKEWIKKAMKLGVADLHISYYYGDFILLLPREVLESETLVKLSLSEGCKIDLHDQKVCCSRLKSLHLSDVCIEGNNNIWDIISMCPLIEELLLSTGHGSQLVLNPGLDKNIFHKLKVLSLKDVETGELFFRDLSSKFPSLKELTFEPSISHGEIQISSNSLESVECRISPDEDLTTKFDIPKIKKFKLSSSDLPSISFKTTSTKWESEIDITKWCPEISRSTTLRKFIQELSPSKIYLKMNISRAHYEYDCAGDLIRLLKPPTVEKLTIWFKESSDFAVLEDLFWICRPYFLDLQFWRCSISDSLTNSSDLMKLICNIPIEKGNENPSMTDLKEVKFHFFRHGIDKEWLSLSCKTLIEVLACSEGMIILVCLQLKWG